MRAMASTSITTARFTASIRTAACALLLGQLCAGAIAGEPGTDVACRPIVCGRLLPSLVAEEPASNDCAYRNRNQWWLDAVAAPLVWNTDGPRSPVVVALFDDGADVAHVDLRQQLWINEAEAHGVAGKDDDGNGYVDDLHGWDFVDGDAVVSPQGQCRGRRSHGTFMASLVAARRNNGAGLAAAGSDGARLMILRIVDCGRAGQDRADPERLRRALEYATRMGARILSFSAHWRMRSAPLDAAFAEIADAPDAGRAAIVVAGVPNKGEPSAGYPASYPFRRIVRAIPIGENAAISPGTSPAPLGFNLGTPAACIIGATAAPAAYAVKNGSSNAAAILAGLLAGIWSHPRHSELSVDEFLATTVHRMSQTPRRSQPGSHAAYAQGVPLADACVLATSQRPARACTRTSQ
jgi:Subtilase family